MTRAVNKNWHQYRTVTKNLPLRNKYDPLHTGANTVCYQIDSGIKADHEMLADSHIEKLHSHDGTFEDVHGHGTQIASIINSKELGVAPESTIRIVDIITGDNDADELRVLDALDAVLKDHILTKDQTKVVCLPWIVDRNENIDRKVNELIDSNLVVVCSAGQKGLDASLYSPAGIERAVTVGAVDYYDRALDVDHPWNKKPHVASNHGTAVNIFAPGVDITSADIDGYAKVMPGTSTSASAAIVAGLCLNILSADNSLTASEVVAKLYQNAIPDIVYIVDEDKYAEDANRLAYQENEHYREVWMSRGQLAEVQAETGTHEIDLAVAEDVEDITSEGYAHVPQFVKIDNKRLVIDSDKNAEPGRYQFILSAKQKDNKFNKSFYIDVLNNEGKLPDGKEFFTEVGEDGESLSTTNFLTFQQGQIQLK